MICSSRARPHSSAALGGASVRPTAKALAGEGAEVILNGRDPAKLTEALLGESGERLSFVEADLLDDRGWAAAAEGMDYIVHTASPMPVGEFRKQDVIRRPGRVPAVY